MDIKFEGAIAFYISTKVFTAQTIIPIFISLYFVSDFIIAIFIRLSLHAKDDVSCNVIHFTKIFYRNLPISPIMSRRMIWQYEALWIVIPSAIESLQRFSLCLASTHPLSAVPLFPNLFHSTIPFSVL